LFHDQTVEGLIRAIELFEANVGQFEAKVLRDRALAFDRRVFREKIAAFVTERWTEHRDRSGSRHAEKA
jgi:hypothetical protein